MNAIECAEVIEVLSGLFQCDQFNAQDKKKIKSLIMKLVDAAEKSLKGTTSTTTMTTTTKEK